MNPKEKAIELIDRYLLVDREKEWQDKLNLFEAKQCAFIAVDEIISAKPCVDFWDFSREVTIGLNIEYWQQVKQEIEKL